MKHQEACLRIPIDSSPVRRHLISLPGRVSRISILVEGPFIQVQAELPGLDPDSLAIEARGETLCLSYRARAGSESQHDQLVMQRVVLPEPGDFSSLDADLEGDILSVTLVKVHQDLLVHIPPRTTN